MQQGAVGTFVNLAQQPGQEQVDGNFSAQVLVPSVMSPNQPAIIYVQYTNTGTAAYAAPLLVLSATQNGQAGAFLSLDSALAGIAYNSNVVPAGFSTSVQFLASGVNPGLLLPGETVTIPVYYGGWLNGQFDPNQPIDFTLGVIAGAADENIDWATMGPSLRPSYINPAAWDPILANLIARLGTTWGQYVRSTP